MDDNTPQPGDSDFPKPAEAAPAPVKRKKPVSALAATRQVSSKSDAARARALAKLAARDV